MVFKQRKKFNMKKIPSIFIFLLTMNFILINAGEILKCTTAVLVGTVTGLGTLYYHKKANYFKKLGERNLQTMKENLQRQYDEIPVNNANPGDDVLVHHENNNGENDHLNELQNIYKGLKSILKSAENYDNPIFFSNAFPEGDGIIIHPNVEDTREKIQKQLDQTVPTQNSFYQYKNEKFKKRNIFGVITLFPAIYITYKIIYYFQHKN